MKNIFWILRKDVKFKGFEVEFIYGIFPVFIIYLTELKEKWKAGSNYGFIIVIKNRYRKDTLFNKYLKLHELTHSKQMIRTLFLHKLLYNFSKKYRLRAETEAYAYNMWYYIFLLKKYDRSIRVKKGLEIISDSLYKYYNLDMSKEYIYKYIKDYYIDHSII